MEVRGTALAITSGGGDPIKKKRQKVRKKQEKVTAKKGPADQLLAQAERAWSAGQESERRREERRKEKKDPQG